MSQGYSSDKSISRKSMRRVNNGFIKEQKQTNTWNVHTGDEEATESRLFRRFIKCKTGCIVYAAKGSM